ncbi:MAG: hypothetical protein HY465_03060 [Deltaproteobacteria bacterium]|nr:hypothetical protein [Deltaproteobacteria bacterium]
MWVPQAAPLRADDCAWEDGGYCVATLAQETLRVIEKVPDEKVHAMAGVVREPPPSTTDHLTGGIPYYNFYDALWSSGFLPEKQAAFDEAAAAGGTKIGGVNLVVLAARTLQAMVDVQWITMEQAQAMVEQAHTGR